MSQTNDPCDKIELTLEQEEELKQRIESNNLSEHDKKIIIGLIAFNRWLQVSLSNAKITINKLRKLFGFKKESTQNKNKKRNGKNTNDKNSPDTSSSTDSESNENNLTSTGDAANIIHKDKELKKNWNNDKNHGRYSADDYPGCQTYNISLSDPSLAENFCPDCAADGTKAKLYKSDPMSVIILKGQPIVSGDRYNLERYRCSVCEKYFTAPMPDSLIDSPKYLPSSIASISINHYYIGMPFKRIETVQSFQGIPLADSTQYDLMHELYDQSVKPITDVLRVYAANGLAISFDDTTARVIEQIIFNKNNPDKKKGIHATALISEYEGHNIYLFDTNTLPAGKQFKELIDNRTTDDDFTTMTDASSSNFPDLDESLLVKWIICLCLSHSRRKFYDLFDQGDRDASFVLDVISRVYEHERYCKDHDLSDEERLLYHQRHSAHIMNSLRIWLNNLIVYKHVEPNSELGKAIKYLLRNWYALTQFLRVAGAKIDNNHTEQTIRIIIRYRKTAFFYKTFFGAAIGDAMMSLLHTAAYNQANIFHYFTAIQENDAHVQASPEKWLPWNYVETIESLNHINTPPIQASG